MSRSPQLLQLITRLHRLTARIACGDAMMVAALIAALLFAPAFAGLGGIAAAQEPPPDSTRLAAPVSTLFTTDGEPPISPRRAFLYSLAAPGVGQAKLGRGNAAALFTSAEAFAVGMLVKSYYDLGVAKRFRRDSIPTIFTTDPETGQLVPGGFVSGQFSPGLVRARRLHVEDWLAAMALIHLLSGIDAFVAAQLWDVPVDIDVGSSSRGTTVSASFRW